MGTKKNFSINKKRHPFIKFESPNPNKKVKQVTLVAKTPIPNHGECYNCNSKDHYVNRCPRPISCRYCKNSAHHISACPILQSKKKGEQETLVAKTPISSRGQCYNCGSKDHYANKCPKSLRCRYRKSPGRHLPLCPKLQNKNEGKLNVVQAPSNTSRGQGISHSIIDGIIMFRDQPIRVLVDMGSSHYFYIKRTS